MAEIPGLRPLRETSTGTRAQGHFSTLNGAYEIYVQQDIEKGQKGQSYYAAKWIKLQAGTYLLRHITDDTGQFLLDKKLVAESSLSATPLRTEFVVAKNGVYRWDVIYRNRDVGIDPAYAVYELSLNGKIVEVSRANDFIADVVPIPDAALGPKPPYTDDERLSYPVFLVKPNWANGIIERMEWLTDVLISESGAEQRRKLRQVPRRSIEAMFNAFGPHRTLIDSYLTGVGARYGLLPLWHDESAITNRAVGGSVDIFGDFDYRDYNVNDVVLIRRDDLFDYELNLVAEKHAGQLVLAYGLNVDTPRGATITPVRVAQIQGQMGGTLVTDAVQQYSLRFDTVENYAITPAWNLPTYARTGQPILMLEPNFRESIDLTFERLLFTEDNTISRPVIRDPGNQVSTGLKFVYHLYGRKATFAFKQMLFRMSGRWQDFHIPTWHNDIALSRDAVGEQGALVAYNTGYTQYAGVQQSARRDILIQLWDGTNLPNTIISSRVIGDEEYLFLAETLPNLAREQVKRISYMPRGRLDIDSVELNRLTDAEGASTVSLTLKTFDERRSATPINPT